MREEKIMKFAKGRPLTLLFLSLLSSTVIAPSMKTQPLFNKSKAAVVAAIAGFFTLTCAYKELSCFEWMKYQESAHKKHFRIPAEKDVELKPVDLSKN